ncbi:hypothetical protein G6O67_006783 [Ophiocordyceps sinensis]|uniref:Uncharacterized protein n=1 Tax=Ophiocordyceps sinensis TaxID=72228 RepID=A0A8H4LWB7_9HYPO|nr:hypothetical protein G6O67_006783 [Ophiocordyceps sinensis]
MAAAALAQIQRAQQEHNCTTPLSRGPAINHVNALFGRVAFVQRRLRVLLRLESLPITERERGQVNRQSTYVSHRNGARITRWLSATPPI